MVMFGFGHLIHPGEQAEKKHSADSAGLLLDLAMRHSHCHSDKPGKSYVQMHQVQIGVSFLK